MVAIPDLALLCLCGLVLALLVGGKAFMDSIAAVLNVSIAGVRPFAGAAVALENSVIKWLQKEIDNTIKLMAKFWHELALSFIVGFEGILRSADGVVKGFAYLWNTALPAFVKLQTDWIGSLAREAKTIATGNVALIARDFAAAKTYAETQAERALSSAQAFTSSAVADAVSAVRGELSADVQALRDGANAAATAALQTAQAGIAEAERLATEEAARLRGEFTGDVSALDRTIADTAQALTAAAQAGVAEAERLAGSALAQSEAAARQALAEAEARGRAALDEVGKIAGAVGSDLKTIEGALGAAGVAGLLATIPAIATLVQAIATEAGLDSAACRAKNKQICGTDPLQWAGLLAGLAALGVSFDLADVVKIAAEGVGEAGTLLADAGKIPQGVIADVGGVIGRVALGIAA